MKKLLIVLLLTGFICSVFSVEYNERVTARAEKIMKMYEKELELTEQQADSIKSIVLARISYFEENRPGRNNSEADRFKIMQKMKKANDGFDSRIIEHLKSDQIIKFRRLQDENRNKMQRVRKRKARN